MSFNNNNSDKQADLYAYLEEDNTNVLETPKKVSSREKKLKILQNQLGQLQSQAQNGFIMGCAVGGMMGAIIGTWAAIKTRKLVVLPLSIVSSGGFFGFMMMCGSIIRTDSENIYNSNNSQYLQSNTVLDRHINKTFWEIKYAANSNQQN
ncbi:hypothetical protein ABPG72_008792 [Tetrahymena utriculariae]